MHYYSRRQGCAVKQESLAQLYNSHCQTCQVEMNRREEKDRELQYLQSGHQSEGEKMSFREVKKGLAELRYLKTMIKLHLH